MANGLAEWYTQKQQNLPGWQDAWGNTYADREDALAGAENLQFGTDLEGVNTADLVNQQPQNGGFSFDGKGFMQGAQGLAALGGLYTGIQNYHLMKNKFNFDKDMARKQYGMAKDAYDRQVERADSVGRQLRGTR